MPPTLRRLVSIAALAALVALAGCKYKGGDDEPSQSDESERAAGTESDKTAEENAEEESGGDESGGEEADEDEQPKSADELDEGTQKQKDMLARAKRAFLTNEIETAERQFEELVETGPVSGAQVSGVIALAQIYIESDRPGEALKLYDDLSDKAAGLPEVKLVIARSLGEKGNFEEAIEVYGELLERQPDFIFALVEMGNAYAELGEEKKAAGALYRYERRLGELADALSSEETDKEGQLYLLDVFSLLNDERVGRAVGRVLDDESAEVRATAARVLGQTGSVDKREALEKMAEEDDDAQVREAAEEALEQLDEYEEATDPSGLSPEEVTRDHDLSDQIEEAEEAEREE